MRVSLGLLADYANVSDSGKLNIMGVFQAMNSAAFPYVHPQMYLVLQFEIDRSEVGKKRKLEVSLINEDGLALFSVGGEMEIPKPPDPKLVAGGPVVFNNLLGFQGLVFEKPGNYEFKVLVGDDHKHSVPLKVLQLKPQRG